MKLRLSLFFFIYLSVLTPLKAVEPKDITYMTENYPTSNYVDKGELKGYAVEILKAMWKKMGVPDQPIQVLPWARGFSMTQTLPNHMLFAMARNEERENLFKWVGPIYNANLKLFSLSDKNLKLKDINEAAKFRVGVIRNDIGDTILVSAGFPDSALTRVASLRQLIMMLKTNRIDMICITERSMKNEFTRDKSLNFKYKPVIFVKELKIYYAFNRSTDDEIISRFQTALTSINEERKSIIQKYNLSE